MNKINDNQTVLEVARVLQPKLKKAVNAFEKELYEGICKHLVKRGMFPKLDRLQGHITTYDFHRVQRLVCIAKQEYENQVMKGLLGFITHHDPIMLPEVEMEAFYEVVYRMLIKEQPENSENTVPCHPERNAVQSKDLATSQEDSNSQGERFFDYAQNDEKL